MNTNIKISDIDFLPVPPRNGFIGFASFILNDAFRLSKIAVHTRLDGHIRLVYPEAPFPNGKILNIVYPINPVAAKIIEESIERFLEQLRNKVEKTKQEAINEY